MFLDANIVVYVATDVGVKAEKALGLLNSTPTLSAQVVNETTNVLLKKYGFDMNRANAFALDLLDLCQIVPVSESTIRKAIELRPRFSFSHWDSLIVAAALEAGCKTLYSEDLQHGLKVDGTTIINPFHK